MILVPQWIPQFEPDYRPWITSKKGRLSPLKDWQVLNCSSVFPQKTYGHLSGWLSIEKRVVIRLPGNTGGCFWIDTNSWRPRTSLWFISESRSLWRSGEWWSFRAGPSNNEPNKSSNPSCGYFPSFEMHNCNRILSNWWDPHVGSLTYEVRDLDERSEEGCGVGVGQGGGTGRGNCDVIKDPEKKQPCRNQRKMRKFC